MLFLKLGARSICSPLIVLVNIERTVPSVHLLCCASAEPWLPCLLLRSQGIFFGCLLCSFLIVINFVP